jgi:hypothetical protein
LLCDQQTLTERARERDNNPTPQFGFLERSRKLVNTIKIDTADRSPTDVVDEMLILISRFE